VAEIKTYWDKLEWRRMHTFRHLPLEHTGAAAAVNECVITRAHDRSLVLIVSRSMQGIQITSCAGAVNRFQFLFQLYAMRFFILHVSSWIFIYVSCHLAVTIVLRMCSVGFIF
jgi:hypothetical protein